MNELVEKCVGCFVYMENEMSSIDESIDSDDEEKLLPTV